MFMTLPSTDARRTPSRRLPRLFVCASLVVLLVGACAGKSETQLATDELNAGLAASKACQSDQAETHYRACLRHNPQNEFCIYNLGVIAGAAGKTIEAENDYRLALLINPNFPSAIFNLALLRAAAGSPDEAASLYRRYIELRPQDAGGHLNLGLLLRPTGHDADANAELSKAVALDPTIVVQSAAPTSTPGATPRPSGSANP